MIGIGVTRGYRWRVTWIGSDCGMMQWGQMVRIGRIIVIGFVVQFQWTVVGRMARAFEGRSGHFG
jgi:hypothetical protein